MRSVILTHPQVIQIGGNFAIGRACIFYLICALLYESAIIKVGDLTKTFKPDAWDKNNG